MPISEALTDLEVRGLPKRRASPASAEGRPAAAKLRLGHWLRPWITPCR